MAKRVTKGNLWGYIQSRPYASVADIRRLFMMDVEGAAPLATNEGAYYIGLPQEAADMIRQLWQEGRILLDLNPDVKARVVQGVYPARIPMGRQGVPLRPALPLRPPAAAPSMRPGGGFHVVGAEVDAAGMEAAGGKRRRRRKRRQVESVSAVTDVGDLGDVSAGRPSGQATDATALAAAGHE